MDSNDPSQQQLQMLYQAYRDSLPTRLLDAERALGEQPEQCQLELLTNILHKLSGSAASFGYQRLGNQSRLLESICRRSLTAKHLEPVDHRQLHAGLLELKESVAQGNL